MKINKRLDFVLIFFILIEIVMSLYLIYDDLTDAGVCGTGGCDVVKNSIYSQIAGVKLIYFALPAFVLLLILFYYDKKFYLAGTSIGFLFAIYLMILQFFVIGDICRNCMIIDWTMVTIFGISIVRHKKIWTWRRPGRQNHSS